MFLDSLLLVVDCAFFKAVVCGQQCYTYILKLYFFIISQEAIDTVKVEGDENVGKEDCIKIKTEQHCIELVRTVKTEQEVSVLCSEL